MADPGVQRECLDTFIVFAADELFPDAKSRRVAVAEACLVPVAILNGVVTVPQGVDDIPVVLVRVHRRRQHGDDVA